MAAGDTTVGSRPYGMERGGAVNDVSDHVYSQRSMSAAAEIAGALPHAYPIFVVVPEVMLKLFWE